MNDVEIRTEFIENKILLIRGKRVMLDRDLAELYGVETKNLNRQEKSELVTNWHRFNSLKHSSYLPYAFTEYGAVMLASVLNSPKAVETSILVVRAFIKLREILLANNKLAEKFKDLECKLEIHDDQIKTIFEVINHLLVPPQKKNNKIGF